MRDALGPGTTLGYCTNVHAGATLDAVRANLARHAVAVRERVCPDRHLGIGLWLAAPAAEELLLKRDTDAFARWLDDQGLAVFTINGFPYADFHQPVVKHAVYQPDWTTKSHLAHTVTLAEILAVLVPEGAEGSISTLPLGWGPDLSAEDRRRAGDVLRTAARSFAAISTRTGRLLHLDVEPEPGCALDRSADVVTFLEDHVFAGAGDEAALRRHLRVCHDVCHAAVMFEGQAESFARYATAGIAVGKVQISSAVRVDFDALDDAGRLAARDELAAFGEDRYLHQTTIRRDGTFTFQEDLPEALAHTDDPGGEWRVHYHVPLFVESFGAIGTTQADIGPCLAAARAHGVRHFEVETYAWDVLPPALRAPDLAAGIARELQWVLDTTDGAP